MAEAILARLYALRALAVFVATGLLLAGLASGAWAGQGQADATEVAPAGAAGDLRLQQERISREIDGWLNVLVDDKGRVVRLLSESLVWRLGVASRERPDPGAYIFSLRPTGLPVSARPCGVTELCPAGYSMAATSREVTLGPLREMTDASGKKLYRQTAKLVLPFDVSWVDFLDDFHAAVAASCRRAFRDALAAGGTAAELREGYLDPELTFALKAAVFSGGRIAETDLAVHLRCWGSGFSG